MTFSVTIAGDRASFDEEKFRERLALITSTPNTTVNASTIVLTVTEGSTNVDAFFTTATYTEVEEIADALAPLKADVDEASRVLEVPVESVSVVQIDPGCLVCIPPSPSAPPPLAPPPPPDWALISVALGLGIVGLIVIACVCWCYAIPKIVAPKLRKARKGESIKAETINAFIERGHASPAEDLDPDLEMNPVAVANIERQRKQEAEAKKKKKKKANAKGRGKLGLPARLLSSASSGFIVAGAFAKLGITITGRERGGGDGAAAEPKRDPKKVDLKAVDIEIEKEADKARAAQEAELAELQRLHEAEAKRGGNKAGKKKAGGAMGKLGFGGGNVASTSSSSAAAGPSEDRI